MWKKSLAFIMIICLISGIILNGRLYSKAEEVPKEESAATAEIQEEEQKEIEKTAALEETQEEVEEEKTTAEQTEELSEGVEFQQKISFAKFNSMVKGSSNATENATVKVLVYRNETVTEMEISTGMVAENVPQEMENCHFVGAYVVTESGEDEIAYIGSYTEENGSLHIYYAFGSDTSTGILLKEGQYIKLVYKDTFNLTYTVQLEDGTECKDGGKFYDQKDTVDYGNNVRVQFKANKGTGAGDYCLIGVKAVATDGTETAIELDKDGYGYLNAVTQNMTIIAKVKKIEQYKLVVDEQIGGHVCWAGHSDEKNSNTKDPYSVNPKLFCSYREKDGATVTAAPGGTIYFVLYSQAWSSGGVWEFKNLTINGKPVDPIYDGKEYTTDLGNGMIAHFRYMGYDKSAGEDRFKDRHLKDNSILGLNNPADKERCKYECWIEKVSEDIHVKFENFNSKNHEIVKLAEADGIEEVRASTFDRQAVGGDYLNLGKNNITRLLPKVGHYDFWKDLLTPVNKVGENVSDIVYDGVKADAPYAQSFWGDWENSWLYSDYAHVEMQSKVFKDKEDADADKQTMQWGSRYIYFKTKPGYDPRTLDAQMTGKEEGSTSGRVKITETGNIYDLRSDSINTVVYSANNNRSMYLARNEGYMWYLRYYGCGINVRNLYLNCNPYQYGVEYDLDGGTIDGNATYTDSNKYTIESGKNKISLPNKNPQKDGYVFNGWKLEAIKPVNVETVNKEEYAPLNGVKTDYDTNDVFTISSENYKAGLETERQEYDITVDKNAKYGEYETYHCIDYIPRDDGNHRFRFVAQWAPKDDPSAPKAEYSVKIYKETAPGTENAVEVDGKTYTVEEKSYVGTKGEDIISIQQTPEGYVLDKDKSVTKLKNFMKDGNTENEICYYYYIPEWKVEQVSDPQGGESTGKAAAVKVDDTIAYTITAGNPEKTDVVLPKGTVITVVVPEGLTSVENIKGDGFDYLYNEETRTITYTLQAPMEVTAGDSIELQYSAKVETPGLFESQAKMTTDWKTCESSKLYHTTVADLTITNTAVGEYADYSKKFKVTITLTDAEGNALANKKIAYKGGKLSVTGGNEAPADGILVLNAKNQASIDLKHGQTITLKDIPYGYKYTVVQKDEKGYTTTYSGSTSGSIETGKFLPGTNVPIVTDVWPDADDFADEYEQKTLSPSGVFEYDGEYYVVCREYDSLTKTLAEQGPGGDLYNWFFVEKLTGVIVEVEDDANSIHPVKRGDIMKYKGEYYVFNDGGEWSENPQNNDKCYKLSVGLRVDITNTCEKVSPTGIIAGGGNSLVIICTVIGLAGLVAAGYGLSRRKVKK